MAKTMGGNKNCNLIQFDIFFRAFYHWFRAAFQLGESIGIRSGNKEVICLVGKNKRDDEQDPEYKSEIFSREFLIFFSNRFKLHVIFFYNLSDIFLCFIYKFLCFKDHFLGRPHHISFVLMSLLPEINGLMRMILISCYISKRTAEIKS